MNDVLFAILAFVGVVILLGFTIQAGRSGSRTPATSRVTALERRVARLEAQLGIPPEPVDPTVLARLQAGDKIGAIKAYREATGSGLKDAKDAVEEIARERGLA